MDAVAQGARVGSFRSIRDRKDWSRIIAFDTVCIALAPVADRLASILPTGGADVAIHRGARRRSKRWSLDAEIDVLGPVRGSGLAINASVGGLRIAVDMGVPVGEVCTLRVRTAPDHQTVEHAKVVWAKTRPDGYLLGLEFIGAPTA